MQLDLFKSNNEPVETERQEITHKCCYVCDKTKPWTNEYFDIGVKTKSDKIHLKGICKECSSRASTVRSTLRKKYMHLYPDKCDCCGRPESETKAGLHLDHCYKTDKFRGWLCPQCNRGIGNLGESVEGLEKAIAYLIRTNPDEKD